MLRYIVSTSLIQEDIMDDPTPWSRRRRDHSHSAGEPGSRHHHPHDHPGADRSAGRRHHPHGGRWGAGGFPDGPEFSRGGPDSPRGPWGRPGGRGPGHHGGRGGRARAGRGDVRAALLTLLAEEPMHGYQLMQAVEERTHGAWRLSPGAVYPTIAQLEDEGLVQVTAQGGRKLVTLTAAGREHLAGLVTGDPFAGFDDEGDRVDLRSAIGELMGAVHQLGRVGDPAQLAAAATVLADARRSLYLILAGAPADRQAEGTTEEPTEPDA
jgi:DNA-binding PadR family transcriptional regulator